MASPYLPKPTLWQQFLSSHNDARIIITSSISTDICQITDKFVAMVLTRHRRWNGLSMRFIQAFDRCVGGFMFVLGYERTKKLLAIHIRARLCHCDIEPELRQLGSGPCGRQRVTRYSANGTMSSCCGHGPTPISCHSCPAQASVSACFYNGS